MLQLQLPKVTDTAVLLSIAKCKAVEICVINSLYVVDVLIVIP